MAKSKMRDRITVAFYEEIEMDMVLLEALNKIVAPRMRGNKLKEWAFSYLKTDKELYEQVLNEIEKKKNPNDKNDNNSNNNNHISKNKLNSKLNQIVVTTK